MIRAIFSIPLIALLLMVAAICGAEAGECGLIVMPPAGQYQGYAWEPDPVIHVVNIYAMDRTCRELGAVARATLPGPSGPQSFRIMACQRGNEIWLPSGVSPKLDWCLNIHEEAHRHLWPSDHPGGKYE